MDSEAQSFLKKVTISEVGAEGKAWILGQDVPCPDGSSSVRSTETQGSSVTDLSREGAWSPHTTEGQHGGHMAWLVRLVQTWSDYTVMIP